VGSTRGIVEAKNVDVVAELAEGCGNPGTREAGSHHDDVHLATVRRIDELVLALTTGPRGEWIPLGGLAVQFVTNKVAGLLLRRAENVTSLGTLGSPSRHRRRLSPSGLELLGFH
jgi:hypothetical protein